MAFEVNREVYLETPEEETTMDRIQADHQMVKRLGHWTTDRDFEVRARRGAAVLDLRSRDIWTSSTGSDTGSAIEIRLDLDHAMVKLLVPDDAVIDSRDLRWSGRRSVWFGRPGRIKDWTRHSDDRAGRRIQLTGEVRTGEIRVHRGGIAVLSALFSRAFVDECVQAYRAYRAGYRAGYRETGKAGTAPTVLDPS